MQSVDAYIALGSNLVNPIFQLARAVLALSAIPTLNVRAHSAFYYSKAVGPKVQANFVNAVIEINTTLGAKELLSVLQSVERAHGRNPSVRWEARTLDLDLLLYGDTCINEFSLVVPHPEMLKRAFVLYPLFEIAPKLIFPNGKCLRDIVSHCDLSGLEKI